MYINIDYILDKNIIIIYKLAHASRSVQKGLFTVKYKHNYNAYHGKGQLDLAFIQCIVFTIINPIFMFLYKRSTQNVVLV